MPRHKGIILKRILDS